MKALIYPKPLVQGQKLRYLLSHIGWEWHNNLSEPYDIVFHWNYKNTLTENDIKWMKNINVPIINKDVVNVQKDYLQEQFKRIFGYDIYIDPTCHYGTCIKKTTQQAVHGARIVHCPISKSNVDKRRPVSKDGVTFTFKYEKFIDTRYDLDILHEVRIPVTNHTIEFVYVKFLGVKSAFHPQKEDYFVVKVDDPLNWMTIKEKQKIELLSRVMGLDFGEFDMLRDNSTGKLYICDMNPIAMGTLFKHLTKRDLKYALDTTSLLLKEML
jgi:hypothetical protein